MVAKERLEAELAEGMHVRHEFFRSDREITSAIEERLCGGTETVVAFDDLLD